jgi:hypothetical protein
MDLYQISKISVKSSGNQRRQPQGIYGASLKIFNCGFCKCLAIGYRTILSPSKQNQIWCRLPQQASGHFGKKNFKNLNCGYYNSARWNLQFLHPI